MIQTRAQLGYRGVVVALFAVLFTYMAFNVADQVLLASGLNGAFGWNPTLVAIVTAILAAARSWCCRRSPASPTPGTSRTT